MVKPPDDRGNGPVLVSIDLTDRQTVHPGDGHADRYLSDDRRRPKGRDPKTGLPEGCPVLPLGVNGEMRYYLDALQQLAVIKGKDHSRLNIAALFGAHIGYLYDAWPRIDKDGSTVGWRPEKAAEALLQACARRGVWDVFGRLRGVGGWLGDDGELIIHCGDGIVRSRAVGEDTTLSPVRPVYERPGDIGPYVYPAGPAQPRPADDTSPGGETGAAWRVRDLLKRWHWARGETDAHLLLGWLGAAIAGGALEWRPNAWITGDSNTGKSTLQRVIRLVLGEAILSLSDATAAGIWQLIGHASVPIAVDELEPDADSRRQQAIIQLARQASSGGKIGRGGASHQATEFTARSCFLFSSVLIPSLQPQDINRIAVLELLPIGDRPAPTIKPGELRVYGQALRRRMLDQWPRHAQTLGLYRQALLASGHSGRGADEFGTLLACADLLLHDAPPSSDELYGWQELLAAGELAELRDLAPDHDRCLAHLMTHVADVYRSGRKCEIGEYIRRACGRAHDEEAADILGTYGIRVFTAQSGEQRLAIANAHQGLAQIFAGSHWGTISGGTGVWARALGRIEGAQRSCAVRIGSTTPRCVTVPIEEIIRR